MSAGFVLHLQAAGRYEALEGVHSFVGRDASGSFGILPGRAAFMTVLDYGLARLRQGAGPWKYLACPGAVLSFADDQLVLSTRRYHLDDDYAHVSAVLQGQLAQEEEAIRAVKDNLLQLEQELYRRLQQLERGPHGR